MALKTLNNKIKISYVLIVTFLKRVNLPTLSTLPAFAPFVGVGAAHPRWAQLGFQEPASPVMEGIIDFHHDLMFFLVFILGFVCWFLLNIGSMFFNRFPATMVLRRQIHSKHISFIRRPSLISHNLWLEIIWTIIPALILVSIVLPSFALIYSMDEFFLHPRLTLKAIGNQWYWTYNYGCSLNYSETEEPVVVKEPQSAFAVLNKIIDDCEKALNESDKALNETVKMLDELDKILDESDEVLNESDKILNELNKTLDESDEMLNVLNKALDESDEILEMEMALSILTDFDDYSLFETTNINDMLDILIESESSPIDTVSFLTLLSWLDKANENELNGSEQITSYRHHFAIKFDSYMKPAEYLNEYQIRLLETDKRVILPTQTGIRVLISSYDVLHSWAIPSMGIKLDGCPGRLNQTFLYIKDSGLFYGQCSEICGTQHAFMPISIRAIPAHEFNFWLAQQIEQIAELSKNLEASSPSDNK